MLPAILRFGQPQEATIDDVVLSPMDRPVPRRFISPSRLGFAVMALLVAAIAVFVYFHSGTLRTLSIGAERLTISTVNNGTFLEYIPVTGNIVPRTTVYLDAIDGGQITAVLVEAGEVVTEGQPLVVLKNTKLQLEVIGREAQLTEQLNNLSATSLSFEQNRLSYRRELIEIDYRIDRLSRHLSQRRPLLLTGAATHSELDDLEADLKHERALRGAVVYAQQVNEKSRTKQVDTLREAIAAMNRNLTITRENLNNLAISAPIAGQLSSLEAHVGESKIAGQPIGQIDELNTFKVSALVDEFYLTQVALDQIATVEIDGVLHDLRIVKLFPDIRNRQFRIDLLFVDNAPDVIRRGQTVRMRLVIGQPNKTLMLENGAFYADTGGTWVFLVDAHGDSANRRTVRFGRRNPEGIEIVEGLREGDRVITSSYETFRDFDRVHLTRDST